MTTLTVQQAAETTGWSPRMLRYLESLGLVSPGRSPGGFRLYGPAELQRLRTLRLLLREHDLTPGDVGLALRLQRDPALDEAVRAWITAVPTPPTELAGAAPDAAASPGDHADAWLDWEQRKHQQLLQP